jgi:hypothetical protein
LICRHRVLLHHATLLVGVAPAEGANASLNKSIVGAFGARWWCLSTSLILVGRGGEEEMEVARWVLVLPLLAGRGGEEAGWCCASYAAALGRGFEFAIF